MNRLERHQKSLSLLDERTSITITTLANILNVSKRTVKYDLDFLSSTHPIVICRGKYGGGAKLISPLPTKNYLSLAPYNLLIKLSIGLSEVEEEIMQTIFRDFALKTG